MLPMVRFCLAVECAACGMSLSRSKARCRISQHVSLNHTIIWMMLAGSAAETARSVWHAFGLRTNNLRAESTLLQRAESTDCGCSSGGGYVPCI